MQHLTIQRELTREELQATINNMALEMTALCNARSKLEKQLEESAQKIIDLEGNLANAEARLDNALQNADSDAGDCDYSDPEFELLNSLCEHVNT